MRKRKLVILILLALSLISLSANEDQKILDKSVPSLVEKKNLSGLGFTAGRISGVGFAYRQYFEKSGVQFTFGLLSNADKTPKFADTADYSPIVTKNGWDVDGWLSFMYLRTIRESKNANFYCFFGGSMNIDYTKKYTQHYEDGNNGNQIGSPVLDRRNNNSYYFGPGIGIDFQVSDYISFIVELPISISSSKKIETYVPQGGILVKF